MGSQVVLGLVRVRRVEEDDVVRHETAATEGGTIVELLNSKQSRLERTVIGDGCGWEDERRLCDVLVIKRTRHPSSLPSSRPSTPIRRAP